MNTKILLSVFERMHDRTIASGIATASAGCIDRDRVGARKVRSIRHGPDTSRNILAGGSHERVDVGGTVLEILFAGLDAHVICLGDRITLCARRIPDFGPDRPGTLAAACLAADSVDHDFIAALGFILLDQLSAASTTPVA